LKPVVRPELRFRRLWFSVGLAIALATAVVCLMPGRNLPHVGISDKLKHLIAFAMLAFWFGSILVRRDLFWLVLALLAFGGLIELAQEFMRLGRDGDPRDLLADAVGVLVGLLLAMTPLGQWARWIERPLRRTAS
jgi:VanZ family protein